jgi:predicted nucleotidyltransferase
MITKILNEVLSSRSNIAVLRALKNYAVGISGREIARITGFSPRTSLKTLTSLENIGIVKRIRGGRDHIFNLNREHFLVNEAVLPLLTAELNFFESIKNEIKLKLFKKCNSVYIFGSVARKEDTFMSDFDICVVIDKENKRKFLENAIDELRIKIFIKFGVTISPFYITTKEFISRVKLKKSPIPDILKDGILIFGNRIERLVNG